MNGQTAQYEHLIERVITIAQRRQKQLGRGCSSREYAYALRDALCDESMDFVEASPGTFVIEQAVAAMTGKNKDELRMFLTLFGLKAGVWLNFECEPLGAERVG